MSQNEENQKEKEEEKVESEEESEEGEENEEKEEEEEEEEEKETIIQYNFLPKLPNELKSKQVFEDISEKESPLFNEKKEEIENKVDEEEDEEFFDPLRENTQKKEQKTEKINRFSSAMNTSFSSRVDPSFLNWKRKKAKILDEYRTDKGLPIHSTILAQHVDNDNINFEQRLKQRLSLLSTDKDKRTITQKKYIKFLEDLNEELKLAWEKNDRVLALKIVIKCTKMLSKTFVPEFYPSMFVIVVTVMDTFGDLVFERIHQKSTVKDRYTNKVQYRLPKEFHSSQVPGRAKEICKNWFYKIASIRELIARVYVEMMIVESRKYLYDDYEEEMKTELNRLSRCLRGMGDPLIAMYARCYLAKRGIKILPNEISYLMVMVKDFFATLKYQFKERSFLAYLKRVNMDVEQFLYLLVPALEWIMESVGKNANEKIFLEILDLFEESIQPSDLNLSFLLNSIIHSFDGKLISKHVYRIIGLIDQVLKKIDDMNKKRNEKSKEESGKNEDNEGGVNSPKENAAAATSPTSTASSTKKKKKKRVKKRGPAHKKKSSISSFPSYQLYRTLGMKFTQVAPKENKRLEVLNKVWKVVTKRYKENLKEYLLISEVFVEYIMKNYALREVNILLKDIYKHVTYEREKLIKEKEKRMSENENPEDKQDSSKKKGNQEGGGMMVSSLESSNFSLTIENILKNLLLGILQHLPMETSLIEVFNMPNFLPIFDILHSNVKLEVSKGILKALTRYPEGNFKPNPLPIANDPVLLNSLFDLAKIVRSSVNFLSNKEEWKEVEDLLFNFFCALDFGSETAKMLDFYVECRKAFPYFDRVNEIMILNVLQVIHDTGYGLELIKINEDRENGIMMDRAQQKRHTKKKNFVKTLFAFVHITLPSIQDAFEKIRYYMVCASVALKNNLIPQAEDLVQQCISLIADLPPFSKDENIIVENDERIVNVMSELSSLLVAVPGHPLSGPFVGFRGLLNAIESYHWPNEAMGRVDGYLKCCQALCRCYHQDQLPYTFRSISLQNIELFNEEKMKKEVMDLIQLIFQQVVKHLHVLMKEPDVTIKRRTRIMCIDFLNILWLKAENFNKEIYSRAVELLQYVKPEKDKEIKKYLKNSLKTLKKHNRDLSKKFRL